MTKKILFPTDFSPASEAAFPYACSLARDSGSTLLIVHVDNTQFAYLGEGMYLPPPTASNPEVERMLGEVVPKDKGVACEHRLVVGDAALEIMRVAQEANVELIVMGTHGRGGLSRLLMGSVSEAVVRSAPCPVLTLKQPAKSPLATAKTKVRSPKTSK